jgi:hypothetical protein
MLAPRSTRIAIALALGSGTAAAQPKPDRPIVEAIGSAPDACFDGKSLADSIATWLGKKAIDARISILVRRPVEGSVRFTVEREQKLIGERDLPVGTLPCPDLRAALSLAIAIAIDSTLLESLGIEPPVTSPSERESELTQPPPVAPPAVPPTPIRDEPSRPAPRPTRQREKMPDHGLGLGLEASTLFSLLPGPALAAAPRIGYAPARWLDLRVSALGTTRAQTTVGGGTASASLFAGRFEGCLLSGAEEVRGGGCLGAGAGAYAAEGSGLSPGYSTSVRWAALTARAEARYPVGTSLGLLVAITAFVPVLRPELEVLNNQGEVADAWTAPAAGFGVSVGGDLRVW